MSLVKEGQYQVQISEVEWKPTRAQTGHYLKLGFKLTTHVEHGGKIIYDYLNFDNPNPMAMEISHKKWKSICYCARLKDMPTPGKEEPSADVKKKLIFSELSIQIKHEAGTGGYTNYKIVRYLPFDAKEDTSVNTQPKQDYKAPPREEAPPPQEDTSYYDDLNDDIPF